jgi:glutathione S-transferase
LVAVTFIDAGAKTRMIFRQALFQSGKERGGHQWGCNSAFDRLDGQSKKSLSLGTRTETKARAGMSLKLYFHPLASFCWKALIALYENNTPFEPHVVDLGDPAASAAFKQIWPIGKFPVLRDDARDRTVPESSIIIEYLAQHYPGGTLLIPADADLSREVRLQDRFYDLYVHQPMQKIVTDRLRPAGRNDPHGVDEARAQLQTALGMVERDMAGKTWAVGRAFSMADCAAAPALFYADKVMPLGATHKVAEAYLERLKQRPSMARVLAEAQPYFSLFPG